MDPHDQAQDRLVKRNTQYIKDLATVVGREELLRSVVATPGGAPLQFRSCVPAARLTCDSDYIGFFRIQDPAVLESVGFHRSFKASSCFSPLKISKALRLYKAWWILVA
jgi:hypothetical protein